MDRHELLVEGPCALALVLVAFALPLLVGADPAPAGPALAVVVAFALASRVEFDVGAGSAIPVQLVFVPMLFVGDPAWAPALVVAGLVLARVVDVAREGGAVRHVLIGTANGWFAVGPALVLTAAAITTPDLAHWPLLVLALLSMFAVDTGVSALRAWALSGVAPGLQLRLMSLVYSVDALLAPVGLLGAYAAQSAPYAFLMVLPLAGLLAVFARERAARVDQAIELSRAYRGTAMLLAEVIGADDAYTGDHTFGVLQLALDAAHELGLDAEQRRLVEFGALLHDVGKISIPESIINKPGSLDAGEWEVMYAHTIAGQRMLDKVGGTLRDVGIVVRASHERWDGGGYPDGLCEAEIPFAARIVAVADAYSAMTTTRSYRTAIPPAAAIEELVRCAGTQFDPTVVVAVVTLLCRQMRVPVEERPALRVVA